VRNRSDGVVAGINVIVPVGRASVDQMRPRYLQPLIDTSRKLGAALAQ
jgi:DNA-binding IclR family transcriptional regulator